MPLKLFFLLLTSLTALAQPPVLGNQLAPRHGTFRIRYNHEPPSLNPIVSQGAQAVEIQFYVVEALLLQNEETCEWQPWLADQWRISNNRKSYDFHLRRGAKWSDGKPVTPQDVKFSFDVIFDEHFPTAHMRPFYESIDRVEVLDSEWVRFHTKDTYFGNFTSSAGLPILPRHVYGDPSVGPHLHRTIVGSGPYVLEAFNRGRNIVLRRNYLWWGKNDPLYAGKYHPERVAFQFVSDDNLAFEMLKKGELDFMELSANLFKRASLDSGNGHLYYVRRVQNLYPQSVSSIGFNLEHPLLKDLIVRRALAQVMNRSLVIEKLLHGYADKATGPWYRQSEFADPSVEPIPYDPRGALRMLRNDEWEDQDRDGILEKTIDGKRMPLRITVMTSRKEAERYLTIFKEDAKRTGIDIQIRFIGSNALGHLIDERRFEAVDMSWGGGLIEFDPKPGWHSEGARRGGVNFVGYKNPVVDQLIDQARGTFDFKKRVPIMRRIYRLISDDVPHAFLFNNNSIFYAYSRRVMMPVPTYKYDLGLKFWWVK